MLLQTKISEIDKTFPNLKVLLINTDSALFKLPNECNLNEKIEISNKNGAWKHQIECKEILQFYCLNSVTYCIVSTDENGTCSQVNKIGGLLFLIYSHLCKVNYYFFSYSWF